MHSSLSDEETIARFLANPTADTYAWLFRALLPKVLSYFRVRGCDSAAAEDLAQEVMLLVYRESRQLRDKRLFRAWLFKIAKNALLQDQRRARRKIETTELAETGTASGDPLAGVQFAQWMKWLEPEEREVILLRYVEGLEYREIGEVLSIPVGTAQWRVFQSKKKLAARFGAPGM